MEYVLDVSKWRCGDGDENSLGIGETQMLNPEGYMCCLGQFAKQKGLSDDVLLHMANPKDVQGNMKYSGFLYDENFLTVSPDAGATKNNCFSIELMHINDDEETTPAEKVLEIEKLLVSKGHTLKVIDTENILGRYK